ncbi:MAG: hypothetical protein PHP42_10815 [Bacteroidota bacterium]|nr:hypothetical protein [Bacteroidota bacterium]
MEYFTINGMLALKLALVPSLIGGVTLAGRRWGPGVAGWLSAFPVVAGPILFFIAIEKGAHFAQVAATSTLSAVLAIIVFGLSYSWVATNHSWVISLAGGFLCYFLTVFLLNSFAMPFALAMPVVLGALAIAPRLYPSVNLPNDSSSPPRNDMAFRMVAGSALVFLVTHFSSDLGARLSGLFAMFPVMASVLVVFTHRQSGNAYAIHLLRGSVFGYYAFASFCFVLALMLPFFSITSAFLAAFCVGAVIQSASRNFLTRYLTIPSTERPQKKKASR